MLLKLILVFLTFGAWAEDFDLPGVSMSRMVNYKPGCDDDLVRERRELLRASYAKEGFQLIQNVQPVSSDAIEALYKKMAAQMANYDTFDFTDLIQPSSTVPPILAPVVQYVREAIDQVTRLGFRDERNLVVDTALIRAQKLSASFGSEEAFMVKMRPDLGSTVLSITFIGTPSFVRSGEKLVPVPVGMPLVITGERRARKFPQIPATEYGEPYRMENRMDVIVRLHPSKGGSVRFELVQ